MPSLRSRQESWRAVLLGRPRSGGRTYSSIAVSGRVPISLAYSASRGWAKRTRTHERGRGTASSMALCALDEGTVFTSACRHAHPICRVSSGNLSGSLSGFRTYPTAIVSLPSMTYVGFVGFVGLYKEERAPEKRRAFFAAFGKLPPRRARRPKMDSSWTPKAESGSIPGCKSLRNLVGLPGFECGAPACSQRQRAVSV
jgi:hypothetical protein